ncbi:hypothetical protein HNR00_004371 [Methylorubrum rhodinum]|uniref:Uncharacterized protein n=1 Tax=Methylorubrum rhodinum TaxID=29428 RepID=A0A840ZS25_9HYPH|nr:hypothetical protein [Methylorubrum rhodinum]MBB5759637.1 hypothetical protein [Methylorubrum rhodinum]
MSASAGPADLDFEEQRARIRRMLDEADRMSAERSKLFAEQSKFAAEQAKLAAEQNKFTAEQNKLMAEQAKFTAEALKLERDRALAPWQIILGCMAAGAAFFGAGAAFIKLIGP